MDSLILLSAVAWATPKAVERSEFTEEQNNAIYNMLTLEPVPGEMLSTIFQPGIMQFKGWLIITVHGITSEKAFLARLNAEIEFVEPEFEGEGFYRLGEKMDGEHEFSLTFRENAAEFYIGGRRNFPGLTDLKNSLYQDVPTLRLDWKVLSEFTQSPIVKGAIALELAFVLFLIFARPKKKPKIAHS